jgi:hypothetical protein
MGHQDQADQGQGNKRAFHGVPHLKWERTEMGADAHHTQKRPTAQEP